MHQLIWINFEMYTFFILFCHTKSSLSYLFLTTNDPFINLQSLTDGIFALITLAMLCAKHKYLTLHFKIKFMINYQNLHQDRQFTIRTSLPLIRYVSFNGNAFEQKIEK